MIRGQLRPQTRATAKDWFGRYHYTGTCAGSMFWGLEDSTGRLQSMVAIGRGGNRFGVAEKFGLAEFAGNLEITRVATLPTAVFNTASYTVARVGEALASEGYEWVFSYADTAQGHHGGIYQALNAIYVGTTARQWVNFVLDGKPLSKRAVSGRFGTTQWPRVREVAEAHGHNLSRGPWLPKLTYILPIAHDRHVRNRIRARLDEFRLPYPKRDEYLTSLSTPYRNHRPKEIPT